MTFRSIISEALPLSDFASDLQKKIKKSKAKDIDKWDNELSKLFRDRKLSASEFDELSAMVGRLQETLSENEIKFEALSVMKEIHGQLADLTFVDVIAVMREENPLRKDVTKLEEELNELTMKVGKFVTDNLDDAVELEQADKEEAEEEKEEQKEQDVKKAEAAAKAVADGKVPEEKEEKE